MTTEKFYTSGGVEGPFDVIIIGSGAGGLTAGAMLSAEGKRVLVLEQHFQPGGYTHTFQRKEFEWDVGVHYLGKASETSPWYAQLRGLTDGAIRFKLFDGATDELHFPDLALTMPHSYDAYEKQLAELFPAEANGLKRYFALWRCIRRKLRLYYAMNLLPKPLTRFARKTVLRKVHKLAMATTEEVMSRYINDNKLKAILDAQWGNIGAPRQHCSFLIHAGMMGNYLEAGAMYPIGGASIFARELGRVIYRNGGAIQVKATVKKLLIRNNTVEGIQLAGGEEIRAEVVLSTTGVVNTYNQFLSKEPSCRAMIAEARRLEPAYEFINLFMGFKKSPAEFGLDKGNAWIHPHWDTVDDEPTWDVSDMEKHPYPRALFFSSSSLRDPNIPHRKHNGWNGQLVTAVARDSFKEWDESRWNQRENAYVAQKDAICRRMLTILDERYPGIKENVSYMELGTPLTYSHFMKSDTGAPYGLAATPARYRSLVTRPSTPVKNLYLAGQDMIMAGVPAAIGSANMACSLILRKDAAARWIKIGDTYPE